MNRWLTPAGAAAGSLVLLALLVAALWWHGRIDAGGPGGQPLIVYAAASVRPPLEAVAAAFEQATGRRAELRFGASEDILNRAALPNPAEPADLFFPADDSYVRQARSRGLIAQTFDVARMRAVLLVAAGNPKHVTTWPDLLRPGVKVAVANPGAAIGKLTRDHLARTGRWAALAPHVVDTGTVTEAANAARVGGVDAAVVWDAVAAQPGYAGQEVLQPVELQGVRARLQVAVLTQSRDPVAALGFARYLTDPARGLAEFRSCRFDVIEPAAAGEPHHDGPAQPGGETP